MTEWISVKDRAPEPMSDVMLYSDGVIIKGWNESSQPEEDPSYCSYEPFNEDKVTHWCRLPKPPTEKLHQKFYGILSPDCIVTFVQDGTDND